MRTVIICLMIIISGKFNFAQEPIKPYSFKTAIVSYEFSGSTSGTQTLYIKDYGWIQCEITQSVTKLFGQKEEKNEQKLTLGLDIYTWSAGATNGTKVRNTMLEGLMQDPNFDLKEFTHAMMNGLGFRKTGTETLIGRTCDVWEGSGATIWVWNDLAIKTEIKVLGQKTIITATDVQLNVPVSDNLFIVPRNIAFSEFSSTDPMDAMFKTMDEQNNQSGTDEPDSEDEGPNVKSMKDLKGFFEKLQNQ